MSTSWITMPGKAVVKAAASHICIEYLPAWKIRALSIPLSMRPQSIAEIRQMYMLAERERVRTLGKRKPVTSPYAASSHAMEGNTAAGGIPVSALESAGPSRPQHSP